MFYGKNKMIKNIRISDLVYVENFGAYIVASSSKFNGLYVNDFYY